jgi:hypothetical protein
MQIPTAFLLALAAVESGNDNAAVGRNGELGALQIGMLAHMDASLCLLSEQKTHYTHKEMHDWDKACITARAYLRRYCTAERLGREPTLIDAARIWHGGPSGHLKEHTIPYANRVMNIYGTIVAKARAEAELIEEHAL